MIAYDLQCGEGHKFEGWFDNADAFSDQLAGGLITCPMCGSSQIERLFSSFTIKNSQRAAMPGDGEEQAAIPEKIVQAFYRHLESEFEDVGANFAKEALKIHYGVSEKTKIRGVTTEQEEEDAQERGRDLPESAGTPFDA